jgi:hypothetical protein
MRRLSDTRSDPVLTCSLPCTRAQPAAPPAAPPPPAPAPPSWCSMSTRPSATRRPRTSAAASTAPAPPCQAQPSSRPPALSWPARGWALLSARAHWRCSSQPFIAPVDQVIDCAPGRSQALAPRADGASPAATAAACGARQLKQAVQRRCVAEHHPGRRWLGRHSMVRGRAKQQERQRGLRRAADRLRRARRCRRQRHALRRRPARDVRSAGRVRRRQLPRRRWVSPRAALPCCRGGGCLQLLPCTVLGCQGFAAQWVAGMWTSPIQWSSAGTGSPCTSPGRVHCCPPTMQALLAAPAPAPAPAPAAARSVV